MTAVKPPTYTGIGDEIVCDICGADVLIRTRHDAFHMALDERLNELMRQIESLKQKVKLAALGF